MGFAAGEAGIRVVMEAAADRHAPLAPSPAEERDVTRCGAGDRLLRPRRHRGASIITTTTAYALRVYNPPPTPHAAASPRGMHAETLSAEAVLSGPAVAAVTSIRSTLTPTRSMPLPALCVDREPSLVLHFLPKGIKGTVGVTHVAPARSPTRDGLTAWRQWRSWSYIARRRHAAPGAAVRAGGSGGTVAAVPCAAATRGGSSQRRRAIPLAHLILVPAAGASLATTTPTCVHGRTAGGCGPGTQRWTRRDCASMLNHS